MCEFLSYIEKGRGENKKAYFLTYDMIYNTPNGEILRRSIGSEKPEDFYGHAAIRKYFELRGGTEKECTNFSTPDNFPAAIVTAIKRGGMRGLATPKGLLRKPLYEKYWADQKSLYEKYSPDRKPLDEKYWADRKPLYEKYWDLFANPENRKPAWR